MDVPFFEPRFTQVSEQRQRTGRQGLFPVVPGAPFRPTRARPLPMLQEPLDLMAEVVTPIDEVPGLRTVQCTVLRYWRHEGEQTALGGPSP